MQEAISSYLDQIKIGRKQSFRNLAMFPLLSAYTSDSDYLLLDEALREGSVEVAEVSEEGSVPELKITNKSPKMVLILDGEEDVTDFMKATPGAEIETHPSVRFGKDIRFQCKKLTGFALSFEDKILHLSVFARTHEHDHGKQPSRMARFSQRRRNTVY